MWKRTRIAVLMAAALCVIGAKVGRSSVWQDNGFCTTTDNGTPACDITTGGPCCTGDDAGTYCNAC
jgi:hypothetical protein